jgi:hypothetical protein
VVSPEIRNADEVLYWVKTFLVILDLQPKVNMIVQKAETKGLPVGRVISRETKTLASSREISVLKAHYV